MKKGLFIAALMLLVMCSCQKEKDVPEVVPESEELVFDITIRHPEDTRAIKSGWVDGDVVFVFFQGVTASNKYLEIKMQNGEWAYTMKNGLKASDLSASGKTLTAVYLPYGSTDRPSYNASTGWEFSYIWFSYYLTAQKVAYSVSTSEGISTLMATLNMINPTERAVQFFIPDNSASGTVSMACSNVKPYLLDYVASDGSVNEYLVSQGGFMTGYAATVGSEKGYYFSGILADSPQIYTYFALEVPGDAGYRYYDYYLPTSSLKPKSAYKINWNKFNEVGENESVSVGGVRWNTVNVGAFKPWSYGSRYTWTDAMALSLTNEAIPTKDDFTWLGSRGQNFNGPVTIGGVTGMVMSGDTGSLFFSCAGYVSEGQDHHVGEWAQYWSSTVKTQDGLVYAPLVTRNGVAYSEVGWADEEMPVRTLSGSVNITSITLDKNYLSLPVGSSEALVATVLPENATNKNLIWRSEYTSIATVTNSGVVNAHSPGTTTISATSANGNITATCTVEVYAPVTGFSLSPTLMTVVVGEGKNITPLFVPSNASNKTVNWSSSDPSVATVSGGSVVGVSAGTATITATTVDGGFTATCQVTVVDPVPVSYIRLYSRNLGTEVSSLHMLPNDTDELSIVCYPENATDKDIYLNRSNQYWSSSHTYVSCVYGNILADENLRNGQSTVSVTVNGKTATCYVSLLSASSDAVDLGLSVKWMNRNFYASSSQGSGVYYTWSEGKNKFHESDSWRLPTKEEMEELVTNCTFTPVNGGYTVTGPNDNTIFLPLAGGWVDGFYYPHPSGFGSCYLTSTGTTDNWYRMYFLVNAAPIVDSTPSTGAWSVRLVTTE